MFFNREELKNKHKEIYFEENFLRLILIQSIFLN